MAGEDAKKNLEGIKTASDSLAGSVENLGGKVGAATVKLTVMTQAWDLLNKILPFDNLRRLENQLTSFGRTLGYNRDQIQAQADAITRLSKEMRIFSQDAIAQTIAQVRTMSPVMASSLVDVEKLTRLGFKAGGEEALKYTQITGRLISIMPEFSTRLRDTKNALAGMHDALKAGGVEALSVYSNMRLAAEGVQNTAGEFRTLSTAAETAGTAIQNTLLKPMQAAGGIIRGSPILQEAASILGTLGMGYGIYKTAGWTRAALTGRGGRAAAALGAAGMVGAAGAGGMSEMVIQYANVMIMNASGMMGGGGGGGFPIIFGRGGRAAAGARVVGYSRFGWESQAAGKAGLFRRGAAAIGAVLSRGWGRVAGAVGGVPYLGAGLRGAGAVFKNVGLGVGRSLGRMLPGLGWWSIGASLTSNMIGGKTGEFLGEWLEPISLAGKVIGGGLSIGKHALRFLGIWNWEDKLTEKQDLAKRRERDMQLAVEGKEEYVRAHGGNIWDVAEAGARRGAEMSLKYYKADVRERETAEKALAARKAEINEEIRKAAVAGDVEGQEAGKRKLETDEKLLALAQRRDEAERRATLSAQRYVIEMEKVFSISERFIHIQNLAVDTQVAQIQYANMYGAIRAETSAREQSALKSLNVGIERQKSLLADVNKQIEAAGGEQEADVSLLEKREKYALDLLNLERRRNEVAGIGNKLELERLGYRRQIAESRESIMTSMRDPMLAQAARLQSMGIVASQIRETQAAEQALAAQGRPEDDPTRMAYRAQIAALQGQLAAKVDVARRTWEDVFTEQVIGMPTGSYLLPGGPSGFDVFGPAYMTGQAPGTRGPAGAGFGTRVQQTQAMFGYGGTGRNYAETLLEQLVNLMSSGLKLEISSPGSAWLRSMGDVGVMNTEMLQEIKN